MEPNCPETFPCISPNVSLTIGPSPSYVSIAFGALSCLGCILIVTAYAAFKGLRRSVAQTIVTHLAIADFFNAFGVIIGGINFLVFNAGDKDSRNCQVFSVACNIQSYVTQWMSITAYIWTSILAVYFMVKYIWIQKAHYIEKSIPFLVIFAWLFPLLFLLPLLCMRRLGYSRYGASNWCYVRSTGSQLKKSDVIVAFIFANWIWELMSIVIVVTAFTITLMYIRYKKKSQTSDSLRLYLTVDKAERRLMLIPIFYVIIHVWDTVTIITSYRLSAEVHKGCTSVPVKNVFLALGIFQGIGDVSQGWVNAILYIFASKLIRKKLFLEPFRKLVTKSRSFMTVSRNTSRTVAANESSIAEFSEVAHLPINQSTNVTYPSETYFSIPYTDIGQRSDTLDPIQRF